MKSSQTTTKTIAFLFLLAVGAGFLAFSHAATERSREYEVIVPPYKSDMVRLVEAYERLSDQYLSLVQHHLMGMEANDRLILQKLEILEKKVDELTQKVEALTVHKPAESKP